MGLLAGIIGAMGIGGGAVLIPALTLLAGSRQHTAQSINLISFIPVAVIALIIHYRKNNLSTDYSPVLILTGLAGALIGSGLAVRLSADILSRLFGIFLFIMGFMEILYKDPK
ncbi:MAG: TSUP family transporter [Clostridia bacterium]